MQPFDLERITASLAAAAIDPSCWPKALDDIAAATGARGAILLPVVGSLPLMWNTPSMDESAERYVTGGWFQRDARYLGTLTFLRHGVVTDNDCLPADARRRSAFYQDFIAKCGLRDFAGVRVGRGEHVWNLSLQRTAQDDPFSADQLAFLAELSDRLDPVVKISAALGLAKANAALDAFQFSDHAAVLVDRAGQVVRANHAAEALIGSDLQIVRGRLTLASPLAMTRLNDLFADLFWRLKSALLPPVILPKQDGGRIVAYAMRLPGMSDSPLAAFHAILVLIESARVQAPLAATLRAVFDLTPAEARLAIAMRGGTDIAAYASEAGLSKATVRNQLKAVFAKTGVTRQAELAAALASLIPNR